MSLFEAATDDELRSTAAWTARQLRRMDWVSRHQLWGRFMETKPDRFCRMVAANFGPDELLEGSATGFEPEVIVVLHYKLKRQTNIDDFFAKRPRME
jgi:hypothetical protein